MDYDQNNDRLVRYRVLNNDQNNDRLVGVFCSKNKMLSYNVHKFTISITIGHVHFQRPICDIFLTLKCCSFIKKLIGIQKNVVNVQII